MSDIPKNRYQYFKEVYGSRIVLVVNSRKGILGFRYSRDFF
jgi:hypothetical protein